MNKFDKSNYIAFENDAKSVKGTRVVGLVGDTKHAAGTFGTIDEDDCKITYVLWDSGVRSPEFMTKLAPLVDYVHPPQDKFLKNSYIVIMDSSCGNDKNFPNHFCFKQNRDSVDLSALDATGESNGWGRFKYNKPNNWRYATPAEIFEYNRLSTPYDVRYVNYGTYGLQIGDSLPVNMLNAWIRSGENSHTSGRMDWVRDDGFVDDRHIEGFKTIDGVVGCLVSNTMGVYIRAEGLKEFMASYTGGIARTLEVHPVNTGLIFIRPKRIEINLVD